MAKWTVRFLSVLCGHLRHPGGIVLPVGTAIVCVISPLSASSARSYPTW